MHCGSNHNHVTVEAARDCRGKHEAPQGGVHFTPSRVVLQRRLAPLRVQNSLRQLNLAGKFN